MSKSKEPREVPEKQDGAKVMEASVSCGLIMPIGPIDGCSAEHWSDVKSIVSECIQAIESPRFSVRLVSDADAIGVIQKRIVQNVYASDVVVCDVSGKNPNVMFELGLRLAFDKPTVIIKDDKTDYSFDTGVIEHVSYPRDLRFGRIVDFQKSLVAKVAATHQLAQKNESTFLKSFGTFQTASLNESSVPLDRIVVEMLSELQGEVARVRRAMVDQRDGGLRGSREEARLRIAVELAKQLSSGRIGPEEILADDSIMSQMERAVDAPRYFKTPEDFRRAVREVWLALPPTMS